MKPYQKVLIGLGVVVLLYVLGRMFSVFPIGIDCDNPPAYHPPGTPHPKGAVGAAQVNQWEKKCGPVPVPSAKPAK